MYYNKTSIHTANSDLENGHILDEAVGKTTKKALNPLFKCIIKFQIEKVQRKDRKGQF